MMTLMPSAASAFNASGVDPLIGSAMANSPQIEIALFRRPHDRVRKRVLAGTFDAGCEPQNLALLKSGRRSDHDDLRPAFGQRSRLVDHERIDLFHPLQRFRILDQHAGLRAAPDADHDRHRRGKAKRAGTGDDQHAHGGDQAVCHSGLRSEQRPSRKGDDCDSDHERHEPPCNLIGQPLDRRARALRVRDHFDDLREQGVAPDLFGAHHETAGLVERAGDHPGAGLLGDRHRFAGYQGLVEGRSSLEDDAVYRHFFSRPDPQFVADLEAVDLDLMVGAVVVDKTGGFRRQLEQRPDRSGRRLARAQFQNLAKQDEHGDNSGGLEVDRDRAVMPAKSRGENIGRDGAGQAVDIGHAGAHRDQGEHVEIARRQRLPTAHEERPAGPQHDRGGEHQLYPVRQGLLDPAVIAGKMTTHLQDDNWNGQHGTDPEPPRHVRELRVWRRIERY
jgi:hypothetical protein